MDRTETGLPGPWLIPLSLFWGIAAALLLPLQLSSLPGPLTLWAYGVVGGAAASAAAGGVGRRLRCARAPRAWVGTWFLMGAAAAVGLVIAGLVTFVVDTAVRSGAGALSLSSVPLGAVVLLYFGLAVLGTALIESALLATISIPLILVARTLACR